MSGCFLHRHLARFHILPSSGLNCVFIEMSNILWRTTVLLLVTFLFSSLPLFAFSPNSLSHPFCSSTVLFFLFFSSLSPPVHVFGPQQLGFCCSSCPQEPESWAVMQQRPQCFSSSSPPSPVGQLWVSRFVHMAFSFMSAVPQVAACDWRSSLGV